MPTVASLQQGRAAFDGEAWGTAYAELSAADRASPLEADDLERLAVAAHLLGKESESGDLWVRAHQAFLRLGQIARAVRCAFWLALPLIVKAETAQGSGWIARARRLLDESGLEIVETGYLRFADALRAVFEGDVPTAQLGFGEALAVAKRFHESDLLTLARLGQGRVLIRQGHAARGAALLDESMAAIAAGEVSPIPIGITYCSALDACRDTFDLRRAQEWTAALSRWCEGHPDVARYGGQCLVHRAEILLLQGAWPGASDEAERARDRLSRPPADRAVGTALYQLAELHRLRGEFPEAEERFRQASQAGRDPQPGLARLRLAQGQIDTARTAIARAMDEARLPQVRCRLGPTCVEIALAAGDISVARAVAEELGQIARTIDAPFLHAVSAHGLGAVLLAEHDPRGALAELRRAAAIWRELEAPYELARTRVLTGLACRAVEDTESAELEFDAAREAFNQLGAGPDLVALETVRRNVTPGNRGGLTARELQVLTLVATGRTNRAIAETLGISEKTVARHVSNLFTKLNLSSRAAATAYAYQQGLVQIQAGSGPST